VAALAALEDEEHVRRSILLVEEGRRLLYREFEALGLAYVPTRANFILVQVPDAGSVYQALLREGVIVRAMGGFGLGGALRITIGTPGENARLVAALRRVLGRAPKGAER
jgi:histidinol-phosphate aminotransferase